MFEHQFRQEVGEETKIFWLLIAQQISFVFIKELLVQI